MDPVSVGLVSALSTFLVGLSYIILKRCARSKCASHNSCFECSSPALEMAEFKKQTTERLDQLMVHVKELKQGELSAVPDTQFTV